MGRSCDIQTMDEIIKAEQHVSSVSTNFASNDYNMFLSGSCKVPINQSDESAKIASMLFRSKSFNETNGQQIRQTLAKTYDNTPDCQRDHYSGSICIYSPNTQSVRCFDQQSNGDWEYDNQKDRPELEGGSLAFSSALGTTFLTAVLSTVGLGPVGLVLGAGATAVKCALNKRVHKGEDAFENMHDDFAINCGCDNNLTLGKHPKRSTKKGL